MYFFLLNYQINLGQQAQPQASPANKSIYFYERSGSQSPQIPYNLQREHLASDSLVLNTSASSKYVNIVSGGNAIYHSASASLPAQKNLPSKTILQQQQKFIQSPNKDYVQINPPVSYSIQQHQAQEQTQHVQHAAQSSSPSKFLNRSYHHSSPTKSIGSAGSRTAMDDINGSDYVCMNSGTLSKKLQQVANTNNNTNINNGNTKQSISNQIPTSQVVYQRSPVIPPLTNIDLKTNYTTPANELPQAQYSTAANQQIDAIAAAKQSVNLNKISNSPVNKTSSPTPSTGSSGKGK